jgi:hypothetical protein
MGKKSRRTPSLEKASPKNIPRFWALYLNTSLHGWKNPSLIEGALGWSLAKLMIHIVL